MKEEAKEPYLQLSDEIIPDISILADLLTNMTEIPLPNTVCRAGEKILVRIERPSKPVTH
jgi:hypothetical protein